MMQIKEIKLSGFNYDFIHNGCIIFWNHYTLYLKRHPEAYMNQVLSQLNVIIESYSSTNSHVPRPPPVLVNQKR